MCAGFRSFRRSEEGIPEWSETMTKEPKPGLGWSCESSEPTLSTQGTQQKVQSLVQGDPRCLGATQPTTAEPCSRAVSHARESPGQRERTQHSQIRESEPVKVGGAASLTAGGKNRRWPEYLGKEWAQRDGRNCARVLAVPLCSGFYITEITAHSMSSIVFVNLL